MVTDEETYAPLVAGTHLCQRGHMVVLQWLLGKQGVASCSSRPSAGRMERSESEMDVERHEKTIK